MADYLTYPTSLSMSIELQNSMQFPSVTICNMNKFRISTVEEIPDLRRIFLYELALTTSLQPIIGSLAEHAESDNSQTIYTWCTISPVTVPSMVVTFNEENFTLASDKSADPGQLFFFNPISGAIVLNETGFCLIEYDGRIIAWESTCEDNMPKQWMTQDTEASANTPIFNANGMAFSVAIALDEELKFDHYYITAERQDFSDQKQLFTRNCQIQTTG